MSILIKIKKYKIIINKIFVKDTDGPTTIDKGSMDNKTKGFVFSN